MFCHFVLAVLLCFVSPALGVTITAPRNGAVIPAGGYHQISWTHTALDPTQMDIYLVNTVSAQATFIATVSVSANLFVSASISFPAGSNLMIQCTAVGNPSDVLAESGPYTVNSGPNPLSLETISGSTAAPSGESISIFSGPAGTGSIAVTTITNALETTTIPTTALVVSSAVVSTTSEIVLTATTTLYTNLANVTSVGSIEVPGTALFFPPPQELPLVIHTVTVGPPVASFRKWKRVADESPVRLAASTISGTRGHTTSTPSSVSAAATTISSTPTMQTKQTITSTPPPVTVTASASTTVVTLPPTVVTITPTNNVTTHYATPQPLAQTQTVTTYPPAPAAGSTYTVVNVNGTGTIQTIVETAQCAICTAGLINAGNSLGVGFVFLWTWIAVVVLVVVNYL